MEIGDIVFVPCVLLEGIITKRYDTFFDMWLSNPTEASDLVSSKAIVQSQIDEEEWYEVSFFPYILVDGFIKMEVIHTSAFFSNSEIDYQDYVDISSLAANL